MAGSSPEASPLPSVRFSTDDFPDGEGWDIWCEQIGEVFDVTLEAGNPPPPGSMSN